MRPTCDGARASVIAAFAAQAACTPPKLLPLPVSPIVLKPMPDNNLSLHQLLERTTRGAC